ncbi:hypothetical protein KE540_18760 [Lachnospiraceae bacterium Marseille-Q4251]|nr:hypothetical protein [Lachnospiraceae bacterium Marseille-Q4251]
MAEVKPRSFRIDEETAEKFKKICLEAGLNQQETLAKLIESYELQAGKAVLTEKRDEIEQFERYTSILIQKYMGALEDYQNVKETVRTEFNALIHSKNGLIEDLQQQKKATEEAMKQATAEAKKATDEADQLRKDLEETQKRCEDLKDSLEDKNQLNKALKADKDRLEAQVNVLEADQQQMEALRKELEAVKEAKQAAEKQLKEQQAAGKKALEDLREKMEIDKERAVLDAEKRLQKEYEEQLREINQRYAELIAGKLRTEEVKEEK